MIVAECPTCHQSVTVDPLSWSGVQRLSDWIARKSISEFTTREAHKGAFRGAGPVDDVKIALRFLESMGDIRALPKEVGWNGGLPSERWEVVR